MWDDGEVGAGVRLSLPLCRFYSKSYEKPFEGFKQRSDSVRFLYDNCVREELVGITTNLKFQPACRGNI